MAGFRFRHVIASGGPEGSLSAWTPVPQGPVYLGSGVSGATGIPVYTAPPWAPYDSLGLNPDAAPTNIQNLLGIYVMADQAIASTGVASTISFSLYRAGSAIGGGIVAGWASALNPAFTLGVPVFVPFNTANTALAVVPGQSATSTTKALLPMQPGDLILATGTDVTKFTGLWAFVNAQ